MILDRLSTIDQVGWLKAGDQTILALHKRVITHNNRIAVTHEDNKVSFGFKIHDKPNFHKTIMVHTDYTIRCVQGLSL